MVSIGILSRRALLLLVSLGLSAPAFATSITVGARIPLSATTFVAPIEISDALNLSSWQLDLVYNPSDVLINTACDPFSGDVYCDFLTGAITEGPFFSTLSPFNVFVPGFITEIAGTQAGLVLGMADIFGGTPPGPSGSGTLAYVEFLIIGSGTSPITVTNTSVTTIAPVPEPATATLLASGLAAILARRARKQRPN